jgi:hypothetical protein
VNSADSYVGSGDNIVRSLEAIISTASETLRPLLEQAFEAGRKAGREEATLDLRAKIDGVLSVPHTVPINPAAPKPTVVTPSSKRASSGSVKPTIAQMIEKATAGLTAGEIGAATNFKPNSIRGTLWTLGNDKLIVKRHGRWFWKAKSGSPERETEAVGASASH